MFFILSKTLVFLTAPSNLLITLAIVGTVLLFTRFVRLGRCLLVVGMLGIVVLGLSPLGKILLSVLENRFPTWSATQGAPTGFIILGGSVDPGTSAAHGEVELTDSAERLAVVPDLARRYPGSRIIFTGGNGSLFGGASEAEYAAKLLERFGVAPGRVEIEDQSRNTLENARLSKVIAAPKPGDHWVLITSAYHMPRAMAAFRSVDFEVEAFPVDWQLAGGSDFLWPMRSFVSGLAYTDWAAREFIGLAVYRLTGHSRELFPGPR
ncbi:MAG: YdcF family protein [Xanthobacteraceae bacterium]|jgi:uncharacterized SAM-binding protein YcdF (DUF218 family)